MLMHAQFGLFIASHILFANDIMIFLRGTCCNLRHLMHFIVDYGLNSSQLINESKSLVFVGKYAHQTYRFITKLLGIGLGSFPFKFRVSNVSGSFHA